MNLRRFLMTSMLVTGFAFPVMAADLSKTEIEKIVHDYIMANPEVLIESVNAYQNNQQAKEDEKFKEVLKSDSDWLYKNKGHFEAGNPKGDVTVVEFFDYNCGYCKQAVNDVLTLIESDKNLRVVFIEIPILGESSREAALWALAAGKQGHYLEFHIALMRHKGPLSATALEDYAKKAGIDLDKLREDLNDPALAATLEDNLNMTRKFGITGTPAFIVGENIIRGYISIDSMRGAIAEARGKKD